MKEKLNEKAKDLIQLMLNPDPELRPNINAVLHHSFFNENKNNHKPKGISFLQNFKEGINNQNNQ